MPRPGPGEIRECTTVWLSPRTPTAPAICYRQPLCTVLAVSWPYARVRAAEHRPGTKGWRLVPVGPTYRIHVDNILRRDPHLPRAVRTSSTSRPPQLAGYVQLPLF